MSWFGFGRTKKKKPEEEYALKLDQLEKLGHTDRAKNLQHLKLYAGDVNKVIQDYMLQRPSASQSPQNEKPKPKPTPPKEVKKEPAKPIIQKQPEPKIPPKSEQKEEPKPIAKKEEIKTKKPIVTESKPVNEAPKEKAKVIESKPKTQKEAVPKKSEIPKATMPKPIFKTDEAKTNDSVPSKSIVLENNLTNLISSDLRQLLLNIGEPMIAEIVFSNSINGQTFYNYDAINALLKKFNVSFGDESSFNSMVQQIEKCYKKNGAVDIYNRESIKLSKDSKGKVIEEKDDSKEKEYELLKSNIPSLISSDVMLLTMPYNVELAQRLYAYSISGADLCKFDYDGIVFATSINRKVFDKACWDKMVKELKLPQTEPFDAEKWKKLQKNQEKVIEKANNLKKEIAKVQKQNKQPQKQQQKAQKKVNKKQQKVVKSDKSEKKRLNKIVQMEKETDKFLPKDMLNVKKRQLNTLTTLHDMAAIVGLDAKIISKIEQSARKQSQRELAQYLKSGNVKQSDIKFGSTNVSAKDVEQRQLKLLSTINSTRTQLEKLAKSKGVSLAELSMITNEMKVNGTEIDVDVLSKGLDALFADLADMALTVQETAKQYGVKLDEKDVKEVNKHIVPMYNVLERNQKELIANINHWNERVKMMI